MIGRIFSEYSLVLHQEALEHYPNQPLITALLTIILPIYTRSNPSLDNPHFSEACLH